MTIPAPSLDAALTELVTLITSQVNDPDVLVCEGPPGEYQPNDVIAVGLEAAETFTPHALVGGGGQGFLHEDYRIRVTVEVYRGGDDFKATRQRCTALVNDVHTAVRTDPSLGGTVYLAYPLSNQYASEWEESHKGPIVRCDIDIHCQSIN